MTDGHGNNTFIFIRWSLTKIVEYSLEFGVFTGNN